MGYDTYMIFVDTSLEGADIILYMVDCSKEDLKDAIDEHAKMHELGIAHGHTGKKLK